MLHLDLRRTFERFPRETWRLEESIRAVSASHFVPGFDPDVAYRRRPCTIPQQTTVRAQTLREVVHRSYQRGTQDTICRTLNWRWLNTSPQSMRNKLKNKRLAEQLRVRRNVAQFTASAVFSHLPEPFCPLQVSQSVTYAPDRLTLRLARQARHPSKLLSNLAKRANAAPRLAPRLRRR